MDNKTISIIGAGVMGQAFSHFFSRYQKGGVKLWDKNSELKIEVPENVQFSTDLKTVLTDSDLVILAVPSFAVRDVCRKISGFPLPPILMISKGMEKETSLLPFQIVKEILGKDDILHLTWSRFAEDFYKETPTTEVLASEKENLAEEFKGLFETDWLKISTSTDLLGVQLAGALKNVIVIGIGLANKGNSEIKQKFIEEGVREMIELGEVMRVQEESFLGPAGKGNLELAADSRSRNFCLGRDIYQKGFEKVEEELKEKNITLEGFHATFAVYKLAKKFNLKLPIIEEVYQIIYQGKNPKESAINLINLIQ